MTLHDTFDQTPQRRVIRWPVSPLRLPFAVLGLVTGLAAGAVAYESGWTWPGVVLTSLVAAGLVGRVLCDAVVGPHRLDRVVFGSLVLAAAVSGYALAALAWGSTWAALLVGGGLGAAVGAGVGYLLLGDLAWDHWRGRYPVVGAGAADRASGKRDALIMSAMIASFISLALAGLGVLAYVVIGLAFAAAFFVSAAITIRDRRSARR
jgi:hypothetical protein